MSVPARVSEILVRFPAQSPGEKASLAVEVLELGEEGVIEICRRLSPPGKADDSLARYALEATGTYAMRPGGESDRSLYSRAVIKALKVSPAPEVKLFLVGRLRQAGGTESIEPLSRLLSDPTLAEPAVRALLAIRAPGTDKALLKALRTSGPPNTANLLRALGELRSREAVGRLVPFASSSDRDSREAALFALANIGDPRTEFLLSRMDIAFSPLERAGAASRYLLFAQRQSEAGRPSEAVRIGRSLVEKWTGPEENQVRSAALTLLARAGGKDVLPDLIGAMDSSDPAFRARALDLSVEITGEDATAQWVAKASEVSSAARAQVIGMLGRRMDLSALGFVKEGLKSDDRAIRIASIEAAARLQGDDCAAELGPLWQRADEEEAEALKRAFLSLPVEKAIRDLARSFDLASSQGKATILEVLGKRAAKDHSEIVLSAAQDKDENIRKKALAALEAVVRKQDLPQTILLLKTAAEPFAVLSLQNALVACARQHDDPEQRTGLIIKAMQEARGQRRIDFLRPLGRIGGDQALRAVVAETRSVNPQVRSVAVYTLANWPDFAAAAELLSIARAEEKAASRKFVFIALQGYVRLATETDRPAGEKLFLIRDSLPVAREPAEINVILEGLGRIRSGESLSMIAPFLADPAFRSKAAWAALDCALPSPGFEGLAGFETARMLKRVAMYIESEYDRGLAERYAHELLVKEGFTKLFNGKDLSGWKGLVKDPPSRARMKPDTLRREQEAAEEEMRRHWQVADGTLIFDGLGQSLCTVKDHSDFELFVDWKIEPGGDSGLYLRGSPQVQIWDPGQRPEGSGGLYNNQIGPAKPLQPADNPVGEWNTFYIRMTGDRVTVHLNGVVVVDNVVMENYWERDKPIYAAGPIELQAHSTPLYFKNIYLRELR